MTGCFQPYGECVWVQDDEPNNIPVAVEWYYQDSTTHRAGVIYNDRGTTSGWGGLNKSFPEGGSFEFYACEADLPGRFTYNCSQGRVVTT